MYNTGQYHQPLANRVREVEERGRGRERVGEKDHSAISDEPGACCYADHREGDGERREEERGGQIGWSREKEGRLSMHASLNSILLSQVTANGGRAVNVKGAECHGMPGEDQGGREPDPGGKE